MARDYNNNFKKDENSVGGRIKKRRKEMGLSQKELGKLIGLESYSISRYETGVRNVPDDTLVFLAEKLNLSLGYLKWGSDTDEGWVSEFRAIAESITNPVIRKVALEQMRALAQMDVQL